MEEPRRAPLTRDEIVRAAVVQITESGLAAVTLRRLALTLGVRAPTLYWHVRDKRELMDLVAEAILSQVEPDELATPRDGQAWWDWLAERSRAIYRALIAHRDMHDRRASAHRRATVRCVVGCVAPRASPL